MRYIHFKEGVVFKRLTPALLWMLGCLNQLQNGADYWPDFTVTSVNDGDHSKEPLSRHYTDEAIDVRSHDFPSFELKRQFIQEYVKLLDASPLKRDSFFIQLESLNGPNEHFHIQVKKGETFP